MHFYRLLPRPSAACALQASACLRIGAERNGMQIKPQSFREPAAKSFRSTFSMLPRAWRGAHVESLNDNVPSRMPKATLNAARAQSAKTGPHARANTHTTQTKHIITYKSAHPPIYTHTPKTTPTHMRAHAQAQKHTCQRTHMRTPTHMCVSLCVLYVKRCLM